MDWTGLDWTGEEEELSMEAARLGGLCACRVWEREASVR